MKKVLVFLLISVFLLSAGVFADVNVEKYSKQNVKFSGKVVDQEGKPIEGYHVSAFSTNSLDTRYFATSKADGFFSIDVIPGNYMISIYNADKTYSIGILSKLIIPKTGLVNYTINSKRQEYFSGLVLDLEKKPVKGIIIKCGNSETVSDENGQFTLGLPPDDVFTASATDKEIRFMDEYGYVTIRAYDKDIKRGAENSFFISDIKKSKVVLQLKEMKQVKILVKDEKNKPIEGAMVYGLMVKQGKTDINGNADIYLFASDAPYKLFASKAMVMSPFPTGDTFININPKDIKTEYSMLIKCNYLISGKVVGSKVGINGIKIDLLDNDIEIENEISTRTNKNGFFSLSYPYKDFLRGASSILYLLAQNANKNVGGFIKLKVENKDISGLIVKLNPLLDLNVRILDNNNKPLKNTQIILHTYYDNAENFEVSSKTNLLGIAKVKGLMRGMSYGIEPQLKGYYYFARYNLPLAGSKEWKKSITLKMHKVSRVLTGRVVDINNNPVNGAEVYLMESMGGNIAISDKNGNFILSGIPNKELDVVATKDDMDDIVSVKKDQKTVIIKINKP